MSHRTTIGLSRPCKVLLGHFEIMTFCWIGSNFHCEHFSFLFVRFGSNFVREIFCSHSNNIRTKKREKLRFIRRYYQVLRYAFFFTFWHIHIRNDNEKVINKKMIASSFSNFYLQIKMEVILWKDHNFDNWWKSWQPKWRRTVVGAGVGALINPLLPLLINWVQAPRRRIITLIDWVRTLVSTLSITYTLM